MTAKEEEESNDLVGSVERGGEQKCRCREGKKRVIVSSRFRRSVRFAKCRVPLAGGRFSVALSAVFDQVEIPLSVALVMTLCSIYPGDREI